jgi:hypothetical protein
MIISNHCTLMNPARILIFGLGDLGVRIARLVVENQYSSVCLLAGQSHAAEQWAQLLRITTGREVRAARMNGQDVDALRRLFTTFEPDLIVQCATLISPFELKRIGSPASLAILNGGFALQAAAQLPIIRSVMQAHSSAGLTCPVINCSYPDVTNPILAAEGLAPSSGIGNVGIMALRFQRLLPEARDGRLQVIGHHAQLGPSLAGEPAASPTPVPLAYLDGQKLPDQKLLLKPGLHSGPTLNHLAAATALPIIRGFLDRDSITETHAPGILGLPGGYPVRFTGGAVHLALPKSLSLQEASDFNRRSAAGDGIDRIGEDGTLFYTKEAQAAVAPWCPELAEPLAISDIHKRLETLKAVCAL